LFTKVGWILAAVMIVGTGLAVGGDPASKQASEEMKWGYKVARRGYWQEALLRFERANQLTPGKPHVLNNIAVAQEANGLFEDALVTYQTGLEIAPNDNGLRRNYARFMEFYENFVAPPEEEKPEEETEEEGDDAQKSG
jgi:Flp pilus assembly protein TadD